ncbi:MAG TPA: biotin--[acetyl-CoA-carboxylase] ligase [Armatimonadota bacterium]|jgi:BirA family biotin operon repressor/biotin-[acetyl-CoA-carboxylase] ligase
MKFTFHRFEKIDSTSTAAARLAEAGAAEGTVVVASEQTAGRGRRGKHWSSPPGAGLYLSIILRPAKPYSELWQLAFVAALAAADAVARITHLPARIKWPNDIHLNGRKVCGILIESKSSTSASERPVIIGIGINVNTDSFPPDLADKATSLLLETDTHYDISAVEDALLNALDEVYAQYLERGFPPILESWRKLDCTKGRQVSVITTEGTKTGVAEGVDSSGDLILEHDDGSRCTLSSGEVILNN